MEHSTRIEVAADNLTSRVDAVSRRAQCAGNVEPGKSSIRNYEAVTRWTNQARTRVAVFSDDIAACIDPAVICGESSTNGNTERSELALPEKEHADTCGICPGATDDVSPAVDFPRIRLGGAWNINGRELSITKKKAVKVSATRLATYSPGTVPSDDVSAIVDPECVGESRARRIERSENAVTQQKTVTDC